MGKTPAPYPKIVSLRVKRHAQRFSAGPQRKNVKNFRRDFDLGGLSCIKKMLENGAATIQLSPHRFRCSLTTKITNDVDHSWVIPIEWAERHFVDLAVPGICQDAADRVEMLAVDQLPARSNEFLNLLLCRHIFQ